MCPAARGVRQSRGRGAAGGFAGWERIPPALPGKGALLQLGGGKRCSRKRKIPATRTGKPLPGAARSTSPSCTSVLSEAGQAVTRLGMQRIGKMEKPKAGEGQETSQGMSVTPSRDSSVGFVQVQSARNHLF